MTFYLIGIDYKTVTTQIREEAYRLRQRIVEYWQDAAPGRTAALFTCNRVEVYGVAENLNAAIMLGQSFRRVFNNCFKDAYVRYGNDKVFKHSLRLACGLESRLKGELQILRQLQIWSGSEDFPPALKGIWSRIIKTGEEIRKKSGLDKNTVDIAELLFDDLKRNIDFTGGAEIMVIGTGKIAAMIAEKRPKPTHLIFVARKRRSRAEQLAAFSGGQTLLREEMPPRLATVDAVISATSSPHCVLSARDFITALKVRKQPLYIYDLAIPRDVAACVGAISFARIKNLDDLALNFSQRNNSLAGRLELAAKLVEEEALKYKESNSVKEDTHRYAAQQACLKTG